MGLNLPVLPRHADCTDCDLHEGAKSVGIPTRAWDGGNTGKHRALLILGKAPADKEDNEGRVLVGENGRWLNKWYIQGMELESVADIYIQNAIRCRLPNPKMSVPLGSRRACRKHWEQDLKILDETYGEVVILCLGAEAISSVYDRSVPLALLKQGHRLEIAGKPRAIFATYLPTYVVEDPAKQTAVEDHLRLCREYLQNGMLSTSFDITPEGVDYVSRVPVDVPLVSLDIESYGYFEGYPDQRFFHPAKCRRLDGASRNGLVLSVAVAWRDDTGIRHRFFDCTNPMHRLEFEADILRHPGRTILGQNIQFDVMMLRAWSDLARETWLPFGKMRLIELMMLNFLDSDQRPERGLKQTSTIMGTTEYDDEEIQLKHGRKFASPADPWNASYNTRDAVATLLNAEKFLARIPEKFGPSTNKGTSECLEWYSDLAWLAISMSEEGILYDIPKLTKLYGKLNRRLNALEDWALERFGITLRREGVAGRAAHWLDVVDTIRKGPCKTHRGRLGRAKRIRESLAAMGDIRKRPLLVTPTEAASLVVRAIIQKYGLAQDKRVKLTDITREVSVGLENIELCMGYAKGEDRLCLKLLKRFDEHAKLFSTLRPMLGLKEKPSRKDLNNSLLDGFTYPTWRIVPSVDDSGESGGTQQGRITPTGRAVQTDPPSVEYCEMSRHPGGAILRCDERQIEMRVPVMYSGEAHIRDDFLSGISPYERTASLVFGRPIKKGRDVNEYMLGKTAVLAIQFRAGARRLQETALKDNGIDKPLVYWEDIIEALYRDRAGLIRVQDAWLRAAQEHGFLEVPVLGISRTFLGDVADKYTPTVVNFPVQTLAAIITLDAQIAAEKWIRANGYRTRLTKNTYDEGVYDVPPEEVSIMKEELPKFYRNPPILEVLYGRCKLFPMPLDCSVDIVYNGPATSVSLH